MYVTYCRMLNFFFTSTVSSSWDFGTAEKGQKGNLFTLRNVLPKYFRIFKQTKEFQFLDVFALVRHKQAEQQQKKGSRNVHFRERINVISILILFLVFLWSPPIFPCLCSRKFYSDSWNSDWHLRRVGANSFVLFGIGHRMISTLMHWLRRYDEKMTQSTIHRYLYTLWCCFLDLRFVQSLSTCQASWIWIKKKNHFSIPFRKY